MVERKRTRAEERAYAELHELTEKLEAIRQEQFVRFERMKLANLPVQWAYIEEEVPVRRRKTRIHAAFDADLVRFFREMGLGYQARMNAVLRAWMLMMVSREFGSKWHRDWRGNDM